MGKDVQKKTAARPETTSAKSFNKGRQIDPEIRPMFKTLG